MANNCLVTKLKAVVNNNNLPYLGYLKFTAGASSTLNVAGYDLYYKKNRGSEQTVVTGEQTLENGALYDYGPVSKFYLLQMANITVDNPSVLLNLKVCGQLKLTNVITDLSYLPTDNTYLLFEYSNSVDFDNDTRAKLLYFLQNASISQGIFISGFGSYNHPFTLAEAGYFGQGNTPKIMGSNGTLEGAVEDFVASRRALGQTSGTVELPWLSHNITKGYNITFEGQTISTSDVTKTWVLSWTSDSITLV